GPKTVTVGQSCIYTLNISEYCSARSFEVKGGDITNYNKCSVTIAWNTIGKGGVGYNSNAISYFLDVYVTTGGWEQSGHGENIFVKGMNVGIGTDAPEKQFHVNGDSYLNGKVGIGTTNPKSELEINGWIGRTAHNNGALVGSYNNVGGNSMYTNPIYVMGSYYKPSTTTLSNMYGIGYTHSNASFISTPTVAGWGMYVAADGDARIFLNASQNGSSYFNAGNVGIGTAKPSYKLHATGDIYANGGWLRVSGTKGLFFESYGGGFYMSDATWIRTYNNKSFYHNTGYMRTDGIFQVGPDGNRFLVSANGSVGIGTISASTEFKLSVKGKIRAEEIKVYTDWADYVFAPNFNLKTLDQVDSYIKENKHLPDVPSEADVLENGVELGEMNKILLQKIEELTLYMIEQNSQIKEMQIEISKLKSN
ncbi:MAG: shufflon system plasmid conjugative transfer pilus tip adhesin PilV, partial [Salinivirgaceae bacterium]|nr:shufflon system plasmid conjugative transfer pilus tip adhesin PilV [Salinivirgaceae bacterium]